MKTSYERNYSVTITLHMTEVEALQLGELLKLPADTSLWTEGTAYECDAKLEAVREQVLEVLKKAL
jgi:hypothetical protein